MATEGHSPAPRLNVEARPPPESVRGLTMNRPIERLAQTRTNGDRTSWALEELIRKRRHRETYLKNNPWQERQRKSMMRSWMCQTPGPAVLPSNTFDGYKTGPPRLAQFQTTVPCFQWHYSTLLHLALQMWGRQAAPIDFYCCLIECYWLLLVFKDVYCFVLFLLFVTDFRW
jgi:hypothetical protein